MINGLFLDPRTWKIDITSSKYWNTKKYGINIDLCTDVYSIPKTKISEKYKFVVASEVWDIPMQKTLEYLRKAGLKIFLLPREPAKSVALTGMIFDNPSFRYNGVCYFKPDVLIACGKKYADLWSGRVDNIEIAGYPRFDYILEKNWNKSDILKKYNLPLNKKIIFFPSYPPLHVKECGGLECIDTSDAREETLKMLEKFANENEEYAVAVKIHPLSFKHHKKGNKTMVTKTLLKYHNNPGKNMVVFGDSRLNNAMQRELLVASDILVGFNSTMSLEALALDKYVLNLLIGNTKDIGYKMFEDNLPIAYSEKDVFSFLKAPYKKNTKKMIENYFFSIDGRSCERICNIIKKYV